MQEIKCPRCGEVFSVDESGYAEIVKQVRDREFNEALRQREASFENEKKLAVADAQANKDEEIRKLREDLQKICTEHAMELERANLEKEKLAGEKASAVKLAVTEAEADKEKQIARLQAQLAEIRADQEKVLVQKDQEILRLKGEITVQKDAVKTAVELAVSEREKEIVRLEGEVKNEKATARNALDAAISEKEVEIERLKAEKATQESKFQTEMDLLKEGHKKEIAQKDEQIDYYKDLKMKMSTKMVGETLEQHCSIEFNRLRATAFPNAYFDKDNDAKTGSKGDFIFRDFEDGNEYISIMFEMKNEVDTTSTKHKNEDFFKELNKDREEKGCEYAVLVSLLEADNDLYNEGIVDVSYRYPKMYVIRPQFFIPLISLLRNAARNSLAYRRQLAEVKSQQLDLVHFEDNLDNFKKSFADSFRLAGDRYQDAIKGIDNTIKALTTVRENLVKSENHLNAANNKLEDVTIKKLTKDAPSIREMFEQNKP